MAVFTGLVNVSGTAPVNLCYMPGGPCTVVLANNGTASPVWVGAGGSVRVGPAASGTLAGGNGFPLFSGVSPVVLPGYQGSAGVQLVAAVSSGSASVGFIVSTATGQTGP